MAVTSSTKWSCPACTFNNWPSCSKCILCGINKPPSDDVIPRIPVAKYRQQNPDWSKLSCSSNPPTGSIPITQPKLTQDRNNSSIFDSSPTLSTSHAHGYAGQQAVKTTSKCKTKGKWTCSTCTYINWPNAGQCVMCGISRVKGSRNEPSSIRNEAIGRLSSSRSSPSSYDSILGYASGIEAESGDTVLHGGEVPVQTNSRYRFGRNSNRGGGGGEVKKKWKCSNCTYENLPGLTKCGMCQNARVRIPTPPLATGTREDSTSGSTSPLPPPLHIPHGRRSSPPSSSCQSQQQRSSPKLSQQSVNTASDSSPSSNASANTTSSTTNANTTFHTSIIHSNTSSDSSDHANVIRGSTVDPASGSRPVASPASLEYGSCSSRERRSPHSGPGLRQLQLNNVTDEVSSVQI